MIPMAKQSYALRKELVESAWRIQAKHLALQQSDPNYWETDKTLMETDGVKVDATGIGIPVMRMSLPSEESDQKTEGLTVAGALKAIPKILKAVATSPDSDMARERTSICNACEFQNNGRCGKCGCFTSLKVRLTRESCPIGKWTSVD